MTAAAHGPEPKLETSAARETLREMAAVIRTVFGARVQASDEAAPTPPAEAPSEVAFAPEPLALAEPDRARPPVEPTPHVPEAPAAHNDGVPALRLVPNPSDDVLPEHRHAVLREVAFLDD